MSVLVAALSLAAVLVAGAWLSLARARRAVTMLGVVSVMVAWKVACRMGAFHTIWMPNTSNSSACRSAGSSSRPAATSGSRRDQVQVAGGCRVVGQFGELGCDGLVFGVQGGVVGADAAAVFLAGVVGHVEGAA